jgi:23S rRNA (cytidine1920-2'-O)/16S rRNA (cytidine1409-2'-O)-methyltransferase
LGELSGSPAKERLDNLLVKRALAPSRSRARDLIRRGAVRVDGQAALKAGQLVSMDAGLDVAEDAVRYVSRGAIKLIAALDAFAFDPSGGNALDVGASTGGFTQVLLERGASHVTCVDVGRNQMANALRNNSRVQVLEGTDARDLTRQRLPGQITAIVADVSFISLTKALPRALKLAAPGCWLVALIKPQFEVGPANVGKGGIVRNEGVRMGAVEAVQNWLGRQPGWTVTDIIEAPISGSDGNQEYLVGAIFSF